MEIPAQFLEDVTPVKKQGILSGFESLFRDVRKTEIYQPEKKPVSLPSEIDFAPGDRVEHKKFGQGIILSVKPFEKDAMLEINFDSVGRKQLMAVFAKLKKL